MFFGLPVAAVLIFISGSFPYTFVYDEESLADVSFKGEESIVTEVVKCEIPNTSALGMGDALETSFRATLRNNTDRFVVISAIGEIFGPEGRSGGMNSQMMILSPNAAEETSFRTNAIYTVGGRYKCKMRYTIGRFDY